MTINQKDVLDVTDPAVTMDLPEEAKLAMEALSWAMNKAFYIYGPRFCNIEKLPKVVVAEGLRESADFLLCNPYNV